MAHESFEDDGVAAVMNEHFRQHQGRPGRAARSRPDLPDRACDALAPDRRLAVDDVPDAAPEPFFGGTYFPKQRRYGLTGFRRPAAALAAAYREQGEAIAEQNERLAETHWRGFEPTGRVGGGAAGPGRRAHAGGLEGAIRPGQYGGFGGAPKFPHATELDFCLRALRSDSRRRGADRHRPRTLAAWPTAASTTSLAGGFSPLLASTREWTIPHFEKMLYDNGPLLGLYADACARHRRRALCRRRTRHRRLAAFAKCATRTGRSTRASTPTARARRASSTCGRPTKCGPLLRRGMGRGRARTSASIGPRTSKVTRGTCALRDRSNASPRNSTSAGRCADAPRGRARRAVCGARNASSRPVATTRC